MRAGRRPPCARGVCCRGAGRRSARRSRPPQRARPRRWRLLRSRPCRSMPSAPKGSRWRSRTSPVTGTRTFCSPTTPACSCSTGVPAARSRSPSSSRWQVPARPNGTPASPSPTSTATVARTLQSQTSPVCACSCNGGNGIAVGGISRRPLLLRRTRNRPQGASPHNRSAAQDRSASPRRLRPDPQPSNYRGARHRRSGRRCCRPTVCAQGCGDFCRQYRDTA